MTAFNKFFSFVEALAEGAHDLGSDQLGLALTAAASPPLATNAQLSDLTEISYANLSSRLVTTTSSSQTGGVYQLVCADLTLTASGGPVGPFRYVVLYNTTNGLLIGFYDRGNDLTLLDGEQLVADFDQVNGVVRVV